MSPFVKQSHTNEHLTLKTVFFFLHESLGVNYNQNYNMANGEPTM